jgi:diguanylate cyclase (GGDEF)-like protein
MRAQSVIQAVSALAEESGCAVGAGIPARLAELLLPALIAGIRDGVIDGDTPLVSEIRRAASENGLRPRDVASLAYLVERAALDELALEESFGETDSWPAIAHVVRQSSFAMLGAFAEGFDGPAESVRDTLTSLHTRPVLLAAVEKELKRTGRLRHSFALILFDVDGLAEINAAHGRSLGDLVLERVAFTIGTYFREQDWVSRCSGGAFGVLLPETAPADALKLAERVRSTVEGRLRLRDYRSGAEVAVTVSAGVVLVDGADLAIDAEQLLQQAERIVERAKQTGRNRVEQVEVPALGRA